MIGSTTDSNFNALYYTTFKPYISLNQLIVIQKVDRPSPLNLLEIALFLARKSRDPLPEIHNFRRLATYLSALEHGDNC